MIAENEFIGSSSLLQFGEWFNENKSQYSKVFILTDENTSGFCLPIFLEELPFTLEFELLEIPAGESSKCWEITGQLLLAMADLGADRRSLILALGGGVITDLGGFVASVYQRGIDCVLIPTSLLAMTDAAIGGKTGVDLEGVKNLAGSFNFNTKLIHWPRFLDSLPEEEWRNGFAETVKHALINDKDFWNRIYASSTFREEDILHSAEIKKEFINKDPKEKGLRKILNFGHTVGHAIESCMLQKESNAWLHGRCVAAGMCVALKLSAKKVGLDNETSQKVIRWLKDYFLLKELSNIGFDEVQKWLRFDKKNDNGQLRFVLLEEIGQAVFDVQVSNDEVESAWIELFSI
jgi:3-dehydroquinate synthase